MEVDISESKSRTFNIFLHYLQLSISVLIALYISELDNVGCENSFHKLIIGTSVIMVAANLIGIIYFRCKSQFSKIPFYIFFTVNLILSGIMLVVSFAGYGGDNICANNKVLYKFVVVDIIFVVIMTLLILFASFYWIQRYSNSPGNLSWVVLFLGFSWTSAFSSQMITIGVISLVISLISLLANGIAAIKGITSTIKKLIIVCWALGLLLMITNEIIAIVAYFQNSDSSSYNDVMAKKLLQIFMAINMIELVLWVFGILTLKYENGDPIRDSLLNFGKNDSFLEEPREFESNIKGFGTIK